MPTQDLPTLSPYSVARIDIHVFRATVLKPVVTSFGTMPSRASVLLRVEDADGAFGWGEIWGNFPTITSEYRARLAAFALPPLVIGKEVSAPASFSAGVRDQLRVLEVQSDEPGPIDGIVAGLDQALWDLAARKAGVALRRLLDPAAPDRVAAYASGLNPADAVDVVAESRARGFRAYKLKIGFGDDTDHANIRGILDGCGDGEVLFTDVNQRWHPEAAGGELAKLADFPLGWVEEPIRADQPAEAWRAVRAATELPIAGGENLRGDAAFEDSLEWLDVVQPDVGKLGGVSGCLAIARKALAAGRTYCPHWLSGGVGLLHSANLMAAAGGDGRLEMDVNENPLRDAQLAGAIALDAGDARLPTGPGIGVDIDTGALSAFQVYHEVFR
ncbi:MAG: mandelate racemase/muconate lactonizing enzyme family protein [Magnetovibrio sp.]|nr:mandelate racemase/muconate lactonizing enzyme family protein [Magnetovibrio sp.]